MKKYLEINKKYIIRKADKMVFSAENMKIYKFNDAGFRFVSLIADSNGIEEEKLFDIFSSTFTKQEINLIINKMLDNKIIVAKKSNDDI